MKEAEESCIAQGCAVCSGLHKETIKQSVMPAMERPPANGFRNVASKQGSDRNVHIREADLAANPPGGILAAELECCAKYY
jgi:hypothetical protein